MQISKGYLYHLLMYHIKYWITFMMITNETSYMSNIQWWEITESYCIITFLKLLCSSLTSCLVTWYFMCQHH